MTSKTQVGPSYSERRRQTVPIVANHKKRRKPRRQSGQAVAFENKESVVQKSRLERTDSDKVIRRNSMERKLSVRNSIKLPEDFLKGMKGLDDSFTRMSLSASVRGLGGYPDSARPDPNDSYSSHGPEFTEEQLHEMSRQALALSDSESEVTVDLDDPIEDV